MLNSCAVHDVQSPVYKNKGTGRLNQCPLNAILFTCSLFTNTTLCNSFDDSHFTARNGWVQEQTADRVALAMTYEYKWPLATPA